MDHPEVRAWLDEAALRPGGLTEPADPEVAAHLETCAACSAERDALQAVGVALGVAIGPPRGARERVLSGVGALGRERRAAQPAGGRVAVGGLRLPRPSIPALAAALGVLAVVFVAGLLVGGLGRTDQAAPSRLAQVARHMGELMQDPQTREVTLVDRAGDPAGLVVHSPTRERVVVLSGGLDEPAEGGYSCFLEREAERVPIGPMHFEEETAFWAGPMEEPDDAGRPGDRFVVVLDDSDGVPVLVGEF